MPEVTVSERVPVELDRVWAVMADLSRLEEWLTLHEAWRSELPDEITAGLELTSVLAFKGMRNRVTWVLEEFDPPHAMALTGDGKGGTEASLRFTATAAGVETEIGLHAEFSNPALKGPIGGMAARTLKGEMKKSLGNLGALAAPERS